VNNINYLHLNNLTESVLTSYTKTTCACTTSLHRKKENAFAITLYSIHMHGNAVSHIIFLTFLTTSTNQNTENTTDSINELYYLTSPTLPICSGLIIYLSYIWIYNIFHTNNITLLAFLLVIFSHLFELLDATMDVTLLIGHYNITDLRSS